MLREATTAAHLTDDRAAAALHIHIALPDSLLAKPFSRPSSVTHGETVALISRSGTDLSRFGIRYSHAGVSLKASDNADVQSLQGVFSVPNLPQEK